MFRLAMLATVAAALAASCGLSEVQSPGADGAPTGPLTNDTSFGGRNDELCYQLKSNPALPGAHFSVTVAPPTGLLEPATVTGTLDGRGQVALGWRLKAGESGDWKITAQVVATQATGSVNPTPLTISSEAGTDDTGNPRAVSAPPCERTQ